MSSNHVTFDENPHAQPEAGPSTSHSAGPSIHPDRLALNAIPVEVKKSKNKSEAQKNREKKKLKKRRKIEKAKKASAPKTNKKEWKPDPVLEALKKSTTNNAVTNLSNGIDEKQSLQKDEGGDEDGEKKVDGTINGESEREKRRREKREKRERRERKEKRKLEREAKLSAASTSALPETKSGVELQDQQEDVPMEEDSQPASVEQHDDEVGSDDEEEKGEDQAEKQPSPEPLEAFPLPRSAPAPAPEILAKQGLPSGLEDAEFIDQSLRIGLDDLKAPVKTVLGEVKEIKTISERMKGKLRETGVEDLFAVQAAILPHLLSLRLNPLPYDRLHDYLISAPTGSGKTLAYAIPIIEILSQRITTRLRALIVLPTRDLVIQVRETLEVLAKGTGLNIGAVTGQHSFTQEQSQLVADMETPLLGGSSKLDILIATPGRLIDHLQSTPNFTLQHLRFLIIDEADRLLNQSFQNWLSQVLSYINPPDPPRPLPEGFLVQPWDKVAPSWMEGLGLIDRKEEWNERPPVTCQKLLFSATLTRDPSKVAALSLTSPKYYIIQSTNLPSIPYNIGETFSFPSTLSEKMLILPSALKPLNLIHLIYSTEFGISNGLIFTKSVESSQRLLNLLQFFNDAFISGGKKLVVKGYTGELKSSERKRILSDFSEGKINLLVCSDLIARGMDLPSVANVISYDVPLDMRKYVHRVGRTARAGREGTAWTLVEKQEALHFKGMMNTAGHLKAIRKVKVKEDDLSDYKESYEIAMKRLKEFYGRDT
ncbi:ATP-dependent RNA helicase DDX51/DBP6 [Kwoniella mangroviensis CBS 10435]|uniref:ATP-dependent RNA helicase n=1 Tax=Kwoniella mangroviensis CBS 10435 TaxID=1331196 RepID=A0A1B9ILF5_9TREE|nr:ATP-dependent RNA helicase DDX51/DBP6 [Kwoniella mangroviensis CBS 10435]